MQEAAFQPSRSVPTERAKVNSVPTNRPPQKRVRRIFCQLSWVGVVLGVRVIRGRYGLVARCKKKDP